MISRLAFLLSILMLTSHCSYFDSQYKNQTGHYKIGKSYTINGITYHPQNYNTYEEIGIASWYGKENHGKTTANGEIFNRNAITAAHKTLPLPCFVLITNLKNDKKLVVRVNDRGPFYKDRIIDLSEKAAKILDFHKEGLTNVKIKYLQRMSEQLVTQNPYYKTQYKKIIQVHYPKKSITETQGYIAQFDNIFSAKITVSKLRTHGIKNVRLLFKYNKYYVKVG